jgi:ornithine cyclodeaminase
VTKRIDITYLNGPDVEALALTDDEIIAAVEPRVHLVPESSARGTSTSCAAT